MTYTSPKTGAPVQRALQIPKTHADLRATRLFSETWADATFGLMGRTPDHVASFFAGYAAEPEFLRRRRHRRFADNLSRSTNTFATTMCISPTPSFRRRSTAASPRTSRATRRFMPAWSRRATTASLSKARSSSLPAPDFRLHSSELHPAAAARRRELRHLRRRPRRRRGVKLYPRRPFARAGSAEIIRCPAASTRPTLRRARQRLRAVGTRLHLSQSRCRVPVAEDAVASLRQSSGADALRHQAALHARTGEAHERNHRQ